MYSLLISHLNAWRVLLETLANIGCRVKMENKVEVCKGSLIVPTPPSYKHSLLHPLIPSIPMPPLPPPTLLAIFTTFMRAYIPAWALRFGLNSAPAQRTMRKRAGALPIHLSAWLCLSIHAAALPSVASSIHTCVDWIGLDWVLRQFHTVEPPTLKFCDSSTIWSIQPLNVVTPARFGASNL